MRRASEAFDHWEDDRWDARFAAATTLKENTALIQALVQELELGRRPIRPADCSLPGT